MGIPSNVAVWLMVDAAAFTVTYPFVQTITGTGFLFASPCINRCAVTGNGKVSEIDQTIVNRSVQKNRLKNIKSRFAGAKSCGGSVSNLANRSYTVTFSTESAFSPFFFGFFGFCFGGCTGSDRLFLSDIHKRFVKS